MEEVERLLRIADAEKSRCYLKQKEEDIYEFRLEKQTLLLAQTTNDRCGI
jgi:hypothetical protein